MDKQIWGDFATLKVFMEKPLIQTRPEIDTSSYLYLLVTDREMNSVLVHEKYKEE